jgi:hypothetical protein
MTRLADPTTKNTRGVSRRASLRPLGSGGMLVLAACTPAGQATTPAAIAAPTPAAATPRIN